MKVILNKDVQPLGEEGDVKEVAAGYARNYLYPRGLALPYTEKTVRLFESRRAEIEARKAEKRNDAAALKERLEALEITLVMPAGANGKLYGAVTNQTVADELAKHEFKIERKRLDLPGNSFKSVGRYRVLVKLYENQSAEVTVVVQGQSHTHESSKTARRVEKVQQPVAAAPVPAPADETADNGAEKAAE